VCVQRRRSTTASGPVVKPYERSMHRGLGARHWCSSQAAERAENRIVGEVFKAADDDAIIALNPGMGL
jgi:hypothetical protein